MNYEIALKKGYSLIKKDNLFLTRHIIEIQKRLQRSNAGFRTQSGTMLKNPATGEIKHIPPQHIDDINRLMANLDLSAYIIKNKSRYYELLENVSKNGEWSAWIEYMLNGIEHTAEASVTLIKEIDDAIREFSELL